jgi:hypothetical protein
MSPVVETPEPPPRGEGQGRRGRGKALAPRKRRGCTSRSHTGDGECPQGANVRRATAGGGFRPAIGTDARWEQSSGVDLRPPRFTAWDGGDNGKRARVPRGAPTTGRSNALKTRNPGALPG